MNQVQRGAYLAMLPRLQFDRQLRQYEIALAANPMTDPKTRTAILDRWRDAAGIERPTPTAADITERKARMVAMGIEVRSL